MISKFILLVISLTAAISVSAQDWAKAKLEKSPRHMEYVTVTNGSRAVLCWVVYPEVKDKATAVLMIHDSSGLTDWARLSADEVAEAGYIAIVPDFLSGAGPNGGGTVSFPDQNQLSLALKRLPPDQITGDLNAAAEYVKALPSANGKLVEAGFCWGGSQSTISACNRSDLKAVFVFYGFYGGNDARVTLTVAPGQAAMKQAGKIFEPVVYDGAGHGFMAHGDPGFPEAPAANRKARDEAWVRLKELLQKI
jgi:carboxymethylenebutenolidase